MPLLVIEFPLTRKTTPDGEYEKKGWQVKPQIIFQKHFCKYRANIANL